MNGLVCYISNSNFILGTVREAVDFERLSRGKTQSDLRFIICFHAESTTEENSE